MLHQVVGPWQPIPSLLLRPHLPGPACPECRCFPQTISFDRLCSLLVTTSHWGLSAEGHLMVQS